MDDKKTDNKSIKSADDFSSVKKWKFLIRETWHEIGIQMGPAHNRSCDNTTYRIFKKIRLL